MDMLIIIDEIRLLNGKITDAYAKLHKLETPNKTAEQIQEQINLSILIRTLIIEQKEKEIAIANDSIKHHQEELAALIEQHKNIN